MEVIHPRCAGLDVHKDLVVACARLAKGDHVERRSSRFGTSTRELLRLLDWLLRLEVTHVAMESTGVYWKPVWHILSGSFVQILGNAKAMKNVSARKSDESDAEWIAELLAHGLIRPSFVPPEEIQTLRDLTRTRTQWMHERGREVQRIQKVLEDANIKLASVLSDITGVSGRKMLLALANGATDARVMAKLADRRVKASEQELTRALEGCVTNHHRFMILMHLRHIDGLDELIASLESRIEEQLEPFRRVVAHLITMPGVKEDAAAAIVAEIGVDMSVFPTADHLVAWSGVAPGLKESGGKKKPAKTKRQRWLKAKMTQCAWAAVKKRDSYLCARYHRIKTRRGKQKAILAVAATMLRAIYHMIQNDVDYQDLGADYFDRHDGERAARRLQRRLEKLGYTVELRKAA
ncbi:MAG TPA: IS110 family transposase [Longimicrobium sp.]|jgi:transposase